MNIQPRRDFLAASATIATACLTGLPFSLADDPSKLQPLFDGKTLKGWHKNPQKIGHGTGGSWTVEDGAIVCEQDPPGSGNGGILLTDKKYRNFLLQLEIMPGWGCDSGLFLRSTEKGQCFQVMIDYHDAGNVGQIYGEGTGGFNTRTFDINGKYDDAKKLIGLTSAIERTAEEVGLEHACTPQKWIDAWKLNDWNELKVLVTGGDHPQISVKINGLLVAQFDTAKSTAKGYDQDKVFGALGGEGHIALQVHGGDTAWPKGAKCRWRKIQIEELPN